MKAAIQEMHHQVRDLVIRNGFAEKGIIILHLVLTENLAGSDRVLPWVAENLSRDSYVNIMNQYNPSRHTRKTASHLFSQYLVKEKLLKNTA